MAMPQEYTRAVPQKRRPTLRGSVYLGSTVALFGLLILPLIIAAVAIWRFPGTITWKEFTLQVVLQSAIITGGFYIARYSSLQSTEHLHGRVILKEHDSESCCHCRQVCNGYEEVCTGTGDNRSCSSQCTGYHEECDHFRDYYWSLKTTLGDVTIEDCEPDEDDIPVLWAQAYVGEPVAMDHNYTNYLLADHESLMVHKELEHFGKNIPEYPEVYDIYKINPVLGPAPAEWQQAFREINADLGAQKQVEVTVLVTRVQDPTFAQAVEAKWLYGPKNSLTVVMGLQGDTIAWARVVTFSKVEDLKVALRDALQGKTLSDDIPGLVRQAVASQFHRTAMAPTTNICFGLPGPLRGPWYCSTFSEQRCRWALQS